MKKGLLFALTLAVTALSGCGEISRAHTHKYGEPEWIWIETRNGYNATAEFTCLECKEGTEGHQIDVDASVSSEITVPSTCISKGTMQYKAQATFSGATYSDTKETSLPVDENAHKISHHDHTHETCQKEGNIEYYTCDLCHKYFSDSNGEHEINSEDTIIPMAHHYIEVISMEYLASQATCDQDASYYKSCEYCHEKSSETFSAPNTKLPHSLSKVEATTATCEQEGNIEYYICSNCNKYFSDENGEHELTYEQTKTPKAHVLTHHEGNPATCSSAGTIEYYTCDVCNKYFLDSAANNEISQADIVDPQKDHEFDGNLHCIYCDESLKDLYSMDEATSADTASSVTLSDLGLAESFSPTTSHAYGSYDFAGNKAIDFWFEFDHTNVTSDQYMYFYLFNQRDESGIVFRMNNRDQNDGIIRTYVFTMNPYSGATTVAQGAGNEGTNFYFPRISGLTDMVEKVFHVSAVCIDEATNLFRCTFTAGIKGGTQYYPSENAEDKTNTPISFDIELGADYFANGNHNMIRFSSNVNDTWTVADYRPAEETTVIYRDANNNVVGKLADQETYSLPSVSIEGKRFIGWFDGRGERVKNGDPVTGKTVVTPRFIDETGGDMFTLSDYGFETSGAWVERDPSSGEKISSGWVTTENSSYDVYFIHQRTSYDAGEDCYSVFGLPYDGIDAQTRMYVRLDERANAGLRGYIYGAGTIGGAGSSTAFSLGEGTRNMSVPLLIHVNVEDKGSNEISILFEAMDLATGIVRTPGVRTSTFSTDMGLSEEFGPRNKFGFVYNCHCTTRVTDAF